MSDNKKYYWLKLKTDFFNQKAIKKLRKIAGGDTYTIIYLKMQLKSLETDGQLLYEGFEDKFSTELAMDIDEKPENVEMTINFLKLHGLIENECDDSEDTFILPDVSVNTGKESGSAERVRRFRERKKRLTLQCNVTSNVTDVTGNTELEKEKELHIDLELDPEKEREKETPSSPPGKIPYIHKSGEISGYIRSWNTYPNLQFCKLTVLQFGTMLNEIRDQLQPYLPAEIEKSFTNFSAILKDKEKYPRPIRYPTGIKGFLMKGVHVYGDHAKPFEQFRDPEYEEPTIMTERQRKIMESIMGGED